MVKDIKGQIKEFNRFIQKYPDKKDFYIGRAILYGKLKKNANHTVTKFKTLFLSRYSTYNFSKNLLLLRKGVYIYGVLKPYKNLFVFGTVFLGYGLVRELTSAHAKSSRYSVCSCLLHGKPRLLWLDNVCGVRCNSRFLFGN